ncbi:MAG: glycosyltransferase [Novosphingobium sp.]
MAERLGGKRLLIVEEALRDFVGHWYEYVRSVSELSRADGAEVTVIAHARADDALRATLPLHPLFPKTLWHGDYRNGGWLWRQSAVFRHNLLVFRTLRRFLRRHGPFDAVFVPTVIVYHIWAWRLLFWLHRRSIGRLVMLIRNSAATYDTPGASPRFARRTRLLRWGIRSFARDFASSRAVFATDSDRLADEYRAMSGIAPIVFPSPRIASPASLRRDRDPGTGVTFACLGPARFEKGIDVLQQAMGLYLSDPAAPPARFVVQWNMPVADAAGAAYEPDPALAADPRVTFLTQPLASEAYDAVLGESDCMVLPYRRDSYFARISGVAVEAVTAGIPIITTTDTWTANLVATSGAGLAIEDGDAAALAGAMAELARDYDRFGGEAQARRGVAMAQHSGAAFLTALWGPPG